MSSYEEIKKGYLKKKEEIENPMLAYERDRFEPVAEKFVEDFKKNAFNGINETEFVTSANGDENKAHEYIQQRFKQDDLKGFVPETTKGFRVHDGFHRNVVVTTVKVEDKD